MVSVHTYVSPSQRAQHAHASMQVVCVCVCVCVRERERERERERYTTDPLVALLDGVVLELFIAPFGSHLGVA